MLVRSLDARNKSSAFPDLLVLEAFKSQFVQEKKHSIASVTRNDESEMVLVERNV